MRGFFSFVFSRLFISFLLLAAYIAGIILLCIYLPSVLSVGAAAAGTFILSSAAALRAMSSRHPAEYRCGRLFLIAALPLVGAALYFASALRKNPDWGHLEVSGEARGNCRYYPDGSEFFDDLFAAVEGAKESVYLEFYIFSDGQVFGRLYTLLTDALKRGVEVKIIADALGCALRLPKKKFRALRRAGAGIKIFNGLFPPPISRLNYRDHKKIAVIDGVIAFSGGINIADEYADITRPHGKWKDCAFRTDGSAAMFFNELFLSCWEGDRECVLPPSAGDIIIPACDCPPEHTGRGSAAIARAIYAAERRVWAFTPYLCLDERLFAAFEDAVRRGADVKIIIPAVPDKKAAYALTCDCAARLKERGADIYVYTPGFMHAKAVICDDDCFLGSYNLDFRSMWLNSECGALFKGGITRDVAADFTECLRLSSPFDVKPKRWAAKAFRLFGPLA